MFTFDIGLQVLAELDDDLGVSAEASDIDRGVAHGSDLQLSTIIEEEPDHCCVTLIGGPMERSHAQLGRHEIHICLVLDQDLDALHALFHNLEHASGLQAFSSDISLPADQVERGHALGVQGVDIERNIALFPLLDDPQEAGWVTIHGSLVDRQVPILILRIEDLVSLSITLGSRIDFVEDVFVLVGALGDNSHEGELVHSHSSNALSAATSHRWFLTTILLIINTTCGSTA